MSSGCGVTARSSEDVEGGSNEVVEEVGITVVGYGVNDRLCFAVSLTEDVSAIGGRKVRTDRIKVCKKDVRDGVRAQRNENRAQLFLQQHGR